MSDCQHGFFQDGPVNKFSKYNAFFVNNLDRDSEADVIYIDLLESFDRLDHGLLLHKLCVFLV